MGKKGVFDRNRDLVLELYDEEVVANGGALNALMSVGELRAAGLKTTETILVDVCAALARETTRPEDYFTPQALRQFLRKNNRLLKEKHLPKHPASKADAAQVRDYASWFGRDRKAANALKADDAEDRRRDLAQVREPVPKELRDQVVMAWSRDLITLLYYYRLVQVGVYGHVKALTEGLLEEAETLCGFTVPDSGVLLWPGGFLTRTEDDKKTLAAYRSVIRATESAAAFARVAKNYRREITRRGIPVASNEPIRIFRDGHHEFGEGELTPEVRRIITLALEDNPQKTAEELKQSDERAAESRAKPKPAEPTLPDEDEIDQLDLSDDEKLEMLAARAKRETEIEERRAHKKPSGATPSPSVQKRKGTGRARPRPSPRAEPNKTRGPK